MDSQKELKQKLSRLLEKLRKWGFSNKDLALVCHVTEPTMTKMVKMSYDSPSSGGMNSALRHLSDFLGLETEHLMSDQLKKEEVSIKLKDLKDSGLRLNATQLQKLARISEVLGREIDQQLIRVLLRYM